MTIHVEYDEDAHTNAFISLADAVEEAFPRVLVDGNDADVMARTVVGNEGPRIGAFEVTLEGGLGASGSEGGSGSVASSALFSALKEGRPPTALEIIEALEREVDAATLGLEDGPAGDRCG